MLVSPIKIQGKKTKLVPYIKRIAPNMENTLYIEPFLGSGEVLFNINPDYALISDNNKYIITFFKALQDKTLTPNIVQEFLDVNGEKLQRQGKDYYYEMRAEFNRTHNPLHFLFLNRSCFNGVMRFNNKGDFNVPFCNKENRFAKALITKIVNQVSLIQNIILSHGNKWKFISCDWKDLLQYNDFPCKTLFFYFDPPYVERHSTYFDAWTEEKNEEFFSFISSLESDFILSNWLSNAYRENDHIKTHFENGRFNVLTIEHFYHVGAQEKNRNAILECLITNFSSSQDIVVK